jgi:hypothetical protein
MTSETVFGVYFKIKTLRWNFDHVKLYFFFSGHNMTDIRVFVVDKHNEDDCAIVLLKKFCNVKGEVFDFATLSPTNYQLILDSVRCTGPMRIGIKREGLIFKFSSPQDGVFYAKLYHDDVVVLFK